MNIIDLKKEKEMNSHWIKLIVELLIFIAAIIVPVLDYHYSKETHKIIVVVSIIAAISTLIVSFLFNDVQPPLIDRASDYSAIFITTDEPLTIEYRISTNGELSNEWVKYEEPLILHKNAIIYARARTLWYKSEPIFRDVFVADNGLMFFSDAEKPGDTIVEINPTYNYRESIINKSASNHYSGYHLQKDDINVIGIDLNGEERKITDYSYSPQMLTNGENIIEIEYTIVSGLTISSPLKIICNEPVLFKLEATYTGGNLFADSELDGDKFSVYGTFEDGTRKIMNGFAISPITVKEGKNKITITKDGLSTELELNAIDRETISENESEPNDEFSSANEIEVNTRYSGILRNEDDIDYYKLRLNEKGRIVVKLTHPKIDQSSDFWLVSLLGNKEDVRVDLRAKGSETETISSVVRVMPGTYYIRVSAYNYSKEKYTISLLFDAEDDSYENEPNDDLNSQAMIISTDRLYTGNLTNENDTDYYKFSINEKRKVWIEFLHNKTSGTNTFWKLYFFDDSDGTLLRLNSSGENAKLTSDCLRLPPGNYYIRIERESWSSIDYSFCVYSQPEGKGTENEDNGDFGTATPISLNSSLTGNIQSERDVDFYTFSLNESKSIQISFDHNRIDSEDILWKYELYSTESSEALKNNENQGTIRITGNSSEKTISSWDFLPSGTYYIKIYPNHYTNDDYLITISN